jgi:integrase
MSKVMVVQFSDAEIRRQAANSDCQHLRDPRFPGLYLRFSQSRERGTWYLVSKKKWNQVGGYPSLTFKALSGVLPQVHARLAVDPDASAAAGTLHTVGELLDWYGDRQSRDRSLSKKRRTSAASAIQCHLTPRLGSMPIADVSRSSLDRAAMWPMQEELSLSYVRMMWGVLVVAFKQAEKLKLIASNPIAAFKFTDFSKARIKPKAARLRGVQVEGLIEQLGAGFDSSPTDCTLALLMLCHGTRIGETRQARWSHFTISETGEWFMPAENTKTRCEHSLPLTPQVVGLLKRYRTWQISKGYEGAYLFPSKGGRPMTEGQGCAVFTRLGQGEWTSHDLRKLARTAWTDLGVDYLIGEMLVNHTLTRNVQTYIHTHAELLKREALQKWHDRLDLCGFASIHGWKGDGNGNSQNPVEAPVLAASDLIQNP